MAWLSNSLSDRESGLEEIAFRAEFSSEWRKVHAYSASQDLKRELGLWLSPQGVHKRHHRRARGVRLAGQQSLSTGWQPAVQGVLPSQGRGVDKLELTQRLRDTNPCGTPRPGLGPTATASSTETQPSHIPPTAPYRNHISNVQDFRSTPVLTNCTALQALLVQAGGVHAPTRSSDSKKTKHRTKPNGRGASLKLISPGNKAVIGFLCIAPWESFLVVVSAIFDPLKGACLNQHRL